MMFGKRRARISKSKYKLVAGRRTRVEVLIFEKGKFTAPSAIPLKSLAPHPTGSLQAYGRWSFYTALTHQCLLNILPERQRNNRLLGII